MMFKGSRYQGVNVYTVTRPDGQTVTALIPAASATPFIELIPQWLPRAASPWNTISTAPSLMTSAWAMAAFERP